MNLNELRDRAWQIAEDKGFNEANLEIGTKLMLVVSELGEAMEALRSDKMSGISDGGIISVPYFKSNPDVFKKDIKDTFEDEIADAIIRLLHLCGCEGIDIQSHVIAKMNYNETRDRKHGKQF